MLHGKALEAALKMIFRLLIRTLEDKLLFSLKSEPLLPCEFNNYGSILVFLSIYLSIHPSAHAFINLSIYNVDTRDNSPHFRVTHAVMFDMAGAKASPAYGSRFISRSRPFLRPRGRTY